MLALGAFGVLVEGTFQDGLAGEDCFDLIPFLTVILVGEEHHPPCGGFVGFVRFRLAVVDGKFLEVSQDGERQLERPGIAAELVGGADFVFDADGGFLGFDKELARLADAEGIVGGFGGVTDLDRSLRGSHPCKLRRNPAC